MSLSIHRAFLIFICIGLLAFHPREVCGARNAGFVLRRGIEDQTMMIKNQRMLKGVDTNNLNTDKKPAAISKPFDPNQSSKRKVRRGSDPIHNRT
ncbi:hypothetical protein CDL12_10184 [Handroanthus impetiginosus]|uniref:CLAVATA3/ESR (CLE)-related protein 45 n=1 Tax=Handroanthus impetiginosus TaxID=429701 RepID=A0A2G9HI04_9LAMI|nr:hypothetical protein CDL12_10184 [Handroanthus impetiginosus]